MPEVRIIDVDISNGWDTESQIGLIMSALRKHKLLGPSFMYSGFDSKGRRDVDQTAKKRTVFVNSAESLEDTGGGNENPLDYALEHEHGAVAVYDRAKLQHVLAYQYEMTDPSALVAVIRIK